MFDAAQPPFLTAERILQASVMGITQGVRRKREEKAEDMMQG